MEKRFAGFWIRVLASFLDGLILAVPTVLIDSFAYKLAGPKDMSYLDYQMSFNTPLWSAYDTISIVITTLLCVLYFGYLTAKYQGTPGKLIVGVRVVGEDGQAISLGRAIGRYFAYIPSSIFSIGYIMVAFSSRKQGMHDKICKTYVVYK